MRKTLILSGILMILALTGLITTAVVANAARDQVTFTERVEYGDPVTAEGITVRVQADLDNHLLWNSTYVAGQGPESETEYQFSATRVPYVSEIRYDGVQMELSSNVAMGQVELSDEWQFQNEKVDAAEMAEKSTGILKAYYELMAQMEPGEEKEIEVRLKDYYDYYPISVYVDLPGYHYNGDYAENVDYTGSGMPMTGDMAFQEFFKIPVLEDETMTIRLGLDANGRRTHWGGGTGMSENFPMWSIGLRTEEACYFTFDTRTSKGNVIDTSQIRGGYGIYRLPYYPVELEKKEDVIGTPIQYHRVAYDEMAMVYELDPQVRVIQLEKSMDGESLLLVTTENSQCMLTVIDLDTMETVQKIPVAELELKDGYGCILMQKETFLVMDISDERLVVLERGAEGLYESRLLVPHYMDENGNHFYRMNSNLFDVDWNGEQLVVAGSLMKEYQTGQYTTHMYTGGFYLAVYGPEGIEYFGEYDSSLSTGWSVDQANYYVQPWNKDPVTVSWE